jgi:hypothetical protein
LDFALTFSMVGDGLSSQRLDENLHAAMETKDKMESRFFLNVVVRKSAAVFELLTCEDKALLVRRDTLLVLNFRLLSCAVVLGIEGECDVDEAGEVISRPISVNGNVAETFICCIPNT